MRVCAYIHKDAIIHNFNEIKKKAAAELMPVIKADGYGHGALTFANIFKDSVKYFAVATVEEALELRKNGIENRILILGIAFPELYEEAVRNSIILTVTSYDDAVKLSEEAKKAGKTALVHIAVDTGMSRIGFTPDEKGAEEVLKISELSNIEIDGAFTHFATADEEDGTFTHIQAERFKNFRQLLENQGVHINVYHQANSGTIMQYENLHRDMVRPGIILYGLYPSNEVDKTALDLRPVMELISHIAYVKTVHKGDTISYGRTFIADREMRIATIPVGYADGYPRLLSNRGRVIINGKYAPIVGRVCMDQFMVDVTDIENVSAGDKVTLIGKQGDLCVSADEIASLTQTINYEVVCDISKRVPRVVK